jgi:hypothetical protein
MSRLQLINRGKYKIEDGIMHKFFELREDLNADIIPPNKCCYNEAKLLIF